MPKEDLDKANTKIGKAENSGDTTSGFFATLAELAGPVRLIFERSRQTHAQARGHLTDFTPPASDSTAETEEQSFTP